MINFSGNPDSKAIPESVAADLRKRISAMPAPHPEDSEAGGGDHGGVSRTMVNFWLDTLLLVIFMALGVTSVIVQFIFPPGIAARDWTLWGMSYGKWTSIQFAEVCLLGVGVLVHVMLHWTWVCSVVARRIMKTRQMPDDGIRTVYGVGLLIVLLLVSGACVVAAMFSIQDPEL